MKLVVHVGLHRAASTSFQSWVEANRGNWERSRCFAYSDLSSGKQGSVFGALVGRTLAAIGPENVATILLDELEQRTADFDSGLLSDENILGKFPGQPAPAFAAAGRIAAVFARLAEMHKITPVVILRDHISWLTSLYRIAQFWGETRSFPEYASHVLPGIRPFSQLLRRLMAAGAPERPIVATLEGVTRDSGRLFLAAIETALGVPAGTTAFIPHKNASPSLLACNLRQQVARRQGMLVLEGQPQIIQFIARLSDSPAERNTENCSTLVGMIQRRTVQLADIKRFKAGLRSSRVKLEKAPDANLYLSLEQAKEILRDAMNALAQPLLPPEEMATIKHRFAEDRQWVAEKFAPEWKHQNQEMFK